MSDVLDLESAIRKAAPAFAKAVTKAATASQNEAEFRTRAWKLIDDFSQEHDLNLQSRDEYRLFNGRADAVYNRFVIEYEPPRSLRENPTLKANKHAVQQVKDYLDGLVRRERHKRERLAGVAWDGCRFIFVMHSDAGWRVEDPVPVDDSSCERFLSLLASLNLERAVQPEYLIQDFGENSRVARQVVSTLYKALSESRVPFVKVMFEQWSLQFKEVCDYTKASKLDLDAEAAKFAVKGKDIDPFKFFFCLHSYYATFIKLLAVQIVQFYLMPKFGTNLRQAVSTDDAKLKAFMDKLERGGIFKDFGINNFLEGDFFKWYIEAWDTDIAAAMRETIKTLANYSLVTLDADPNTTRDILKVLYQGLVPKKLRHNLGEYYTPDWLAERLINVTVVGDLKPTDKVLDPACGSGTFLVLCIKKMREYARKKMLPEAEVLDKILLNVVGFDLNPLAVISARTNYLLALGDLLEHRKGDISLPVYLCDSVCTPSEGEDIFDKDRFKIKTAVGEFTLPKSVVRKDLIKRMAEVMEELVEVEQDRDGATKRLAAELKLDPKKDAVDLGLLADLYERLLDLKRGRINGVWARVIKNAFAPLFLTGFDYVVGNPPWVNWANLPEKYRVEEVVPLFQHKYGLFPHKGLRARHGSSEMDVSALMTYVVADMNLRVRGRLGFLITQTVFKTDASKGFRKFELPDGTPLGVVHVDDLVALQPFDGATNRTAAFVLQKGRKTEFDKFAYWVWRKKPDAARTLPQDATWKDVEEKVTFNKCVAAPVDEADPTTQWLTGRRLAIQALGKVLGEAAYTAHIGAHTVGANGVYWVRTVEELPGGLVVIANVTEGAKRAVESVQARVESELLHPMIRGRDVSRWAVSSTLHMLVPQRTEDPKYAIPIEEMRERYPKTLQWFLGFRQALAERKSRIVRAFAEKQAFYFLYSVKEYTFAPWKVVWSEVGDAIRAGVVGPRHERTVVPDHTLVMVGCTGRHEAHFLCAVLNSAPANYVVRAYIALHPSPHVLTNIRVPKFKLKDAVHTELARLSEQAHEATAEGDTKRVAEIEEEIDVLAAKLWGLSDKELKEIKLALEELR